VSGKLLARKSRERLVVVWIRVAAASFGMIILAFSGSRNESGVYEIAVERLPSTQLSLNHEP
jgi:hypothetical protein